ncbi:MAG: tetratricopeptide repeat protein [Thermochromatium sp.]
MTGILAIAASLLARLPKRAFLFQLLPGLFLWGALALAAVLLTPALNGGFLFDDFYNLDALGAYGGVRDWTTLKAYLASGFSAGPSGRPLALLSFLIDANDWPASPYSFKRTNLGLHLINGVLLAWATLKLLTASGHPPARAAWAAVLTSSLWLLHPFLISTTFYPVQRMAMLAATFSFAAFVAYWHGRALLPLAPRRALLWMGGSLIVGTLLATFSKENGALLPLLILVTEFSLAGRLPRLPRWFLVLFLALPAAVIVGYLLSQLNLSPHPWSNRPFNAIERLLTEARIVWDYLGWWFLPRIEDAGLFRDAYPISRSLFTPPTTLPAVIGLLALLGAAVLVRRSHPWLALAVLFFFAGHLMESTWLGLELYFEHRNYLPTAYLFLPLALYLTAPRAKLRLRVRATAALLILTALATFSHLRAQLWSNPVQLEAYWAAAAPDSPRAANALARHYLDWAQDPARAREILDAALAKNPHDGLLILSKLQLEINLGSADSESFAQASARLQAASLDGQTMLGLRSMVESLMDRKASAAYREQMRQLIDRLAENPKWRSDRYLARLLPYLLAQLALADGHPKEAEKYYREAIDRYRTVDAAMQMTAEMGNAGYPEAALRLLDSAEALLRQEDRRSLPLDRETYAREIARIRTLLLEDQQTRKATKENE